MFVKKATSPCIRHTVIVGVIRFIIRVGSISEIDLFSGGLSNVCSASLSRNLQQEGVVSGDEKPAEYGTVVWVSSPRGGSNMGVGSKHRNHSQPRRLTMMDLRVDAKLGCSTTSQGYGVACVLAGIDELGEYIIDSATP